MFADKNDKIELDKLLEDWTDGAPEIKNAFISFRDHLETLDNTLLSFVGRPGVTYSLRATVKDPAVKDKPMFVMVDIIDDDPADRWLSVCFFNEMIQDPDEMGDFVPGGLLGADAHCFDYDRADHDLEKYITLRIDEAHAAMSGV